MDFTYNVGQGYDFTESGAGVYNVKLSRDFFWVLVDDVLTTVKVDVKSSKVTIKGKLAGEASQRKNMKSSKRDTNKRASSLKTRSCHADDIAIIEEAVPTANQLVASSVQTLDTMKPDGSNRAPYEYWFGDWNTKPNLFQAYWPRKHVETIYKGIHPFGVGGDQGGYTYDCDCNQNIMAWVTIRKEPVINLCLGFFSELIKVAEGYNMKAGTLIHEATYFPYVRPRGRDLARDPTSAHDLRSKPFEAIINSDSYEYFAEDRYPPTL